MLRKALQYQRLAGGVIALHEEDPALSGDGVMHEGAVSARLGVAGIPSISESTMVARDRAIARYEDARVHFQHLSCVESVQALAAAREAGGARVSGEATPHHLTLTDEAVARLDSSFKMNPPLRTEADRQAVIEGLRIGVIECIATDHAPHARHEKEMPFEQAPMGTTGLETAFAAIYTELVRPGVLPLRAGGRADDRRRRAVRAADPDDRARTSRRTSCWSISRPSGRSAPTATPAARQNCCFHGRTLQRRGRADGRRRGGRVRHRRTWTHDHGGSRVSRDAYVLLEDGTRFDGLACGADTHAVGEIVFTTSMSGYQEAMTDPSYAGQLITFTYPQIGNYGVSEQRDGVRPDPRPRRDHARRRRLRRRADRRAGLAAAG